MEIGKFSPCFHKSELNFWGDKPKSIHAFLHSCHPSLNCFGHYTFLKFCFGIFGRNVMQAYAQTLSSIVPYWHAFDMACPKHVPWKDSSNLKLSHEFWQQLSKLLSLLSSLHLNLWCKQAFFFNFQIFRAM
jgi:hypothetical protein